MYADIYKLLPQVFECECSVTTLNQDSLLALGEIYKTYETFNKANTEYPPMKFLDMAFFRESYDKSAVDGDADNENADEE